MRKEDVKDDKAFVAFPVTAWTVLLDPIRERSEGMDRSLEELCRTYSAPVYSYLRSRGFPHHEAQDVQQEFLVQLVSRDAFSNVYREKGRFRSFLLACLNNFLSNRLAREHAQKRGAGVVPISLEQAPQDQLASSVPEASFDREWAVGVANGAFDVLERAYETRGQSRLFKDLKGFLPGAWSEPDREALQSLHNLSPGALDVAVHRLRQRYGAALRQRILATLADPADLDAELRFLVHCLNC